jgi:chromate transporter
MVHGAARLSMSEPQQGEEPQESKLPRLWTFLRYFLGLGTWGFGGPIAAVDYMRRDLVERRRWLSSEDFLNGVALGQTMPGPLAAQVVMWVGYLEGGAVGALATAAAFILPSLLLVLIVAYVYVQFQGLHAVQSLFYGIAPAVMAIIGFAAVKLARLTHQSDLRLWSISLVIFGVTARQPHRCNVVSHTDAVSVVLVADLRLRARTIIRAPPSSPIRTGFTVTVWREFRQGSP